MDGWYRSQSGLEQSHHIIVAYVTVYIGPWYWYIQAGLCALTGVVCVYRLLWLRELWIETYFRRLVV